MLIAVLQQLNKAHQTCNNRQACLQQDVQLLASLQQKYSQDQRFVNQLDSLIQLINQANNQDIFATPQFLNGYVAHLRANQPMRYVSKVAEDFEMIKSKVALSAKVRAVQLDESKHKPKSARDEARDNLKATGKEMLGSLVGQTSEAGSVAAGEVKPKKLIGGLLGKLLGF